MMGDLHEKNLQPFHEIESKMIAHHTKDFEKVQQKYNSPGLAKTILIKEKDLPRCPISSSPVQSPP
jgi:hypothetical protein